MIKYKTLKPEKIIINDGLFLFADWEEPRGRAIIMCKSQGQPNIKVFWNQTILHLRPDVVIDVGANYGEVIFNTRYPLETKYIIGIEANPNLHKYLQKSQSFHPDKDRIIILNKLAADTSDNSMDFYIDKKSSGRSSALKNNFVKSIILVKADSIRIDNFILSITEPKMILFKIDVEGYESFVLKGMKHLFTENIELIGCIEFNLLSLKNNKINPEEYITYLNSHFIVCIFYKNGKIERLKPLSVGLIEEKVDNKYKEIDLLLFSTEILYNKYMNIYKQGYYDLHS